MSKTYKRLLTICFALMFTLVMEAAQHPVRHATPNGPDRAATRGKTNKPGKTLGSAPGAGAEGAAASPAPSPEEAREMPARLPHRREAPLGYEFDLQMLKTLKSNAPTFRGIPPSAVEDATPAETPTTPERPGRGGAGPGVKSVSPKKSSAGPSPSAPNPASSFEGIYYTGWIPPDNGTATGPNHVLEMVNSSWRAFAKDGAPATSLVPFCGGGGFWSPVLPSGVTWCFDPKVVYDQFDARWVMGAVAMTNTQDQSWYLLATSKTSDPTGEWCRWSLDATVNGSTPADNWADYPGLGLDSNAIYISSNQFSVAGSFQYTKLRILGKTQLYNNTCGSVTWWDFWNLTNPDGSLAFSVKPAHTYGNPGVEYLVNSRSGYGSSITLWSLTNPLGTPPSLSRVDIPVATYSAPPNANQCSNATPINTGDARLLNAIYRGGFLWTAHTIAWGAYSRARYLRIEPGTSGVLDDFAFGLDGYFYYYPAIADDAEGNIYTVFNRSSADECVGIRYSGRPSSDPPNTFQGSALLQGGQASYVRTDGSGRNRWGDYSGISPDPDLTGAVWIAGEYATATNVWSTRIGRLEYAASPAPSNDDYANRIIVTDVPFSHTVDTTTATTEPSDPVPSCGSGSRANSVWYEFTPSQDGTITADTIGSSYDTILAAFTGSLGSFAEQVCNDDYSGLQSRIEFSATAGTAYAFMVTAYSAGGGSLDFNLSFTPTAPPNDDYVNRIIIPSAPFAHSVDTTAATTEPSDPVPGCGSGSRANSVWYQFTASQDGTITAETTGSSYDTILAAFTGSPGAFAQQACNDDYSGLQSRIDFSAAAGTAYAFMVTDSSGGGGSLVFSLNFTGAATLTIAPPSLMFGAQQIGTTSPPQTVTLTNTSELSVTLNSIGVAGGNSSDFARTSTCGGSLEPGQSCTISVTFHPTVAGARKGSVVVTDTAAGSPHTIILTGLGTQ
jgi:hypothetical protein